MREIICTGPEPPAGQQFCAMCALRFKQEVMDLPGVQEKIQELMRGPAENGPARVSLTELAEGTLIVRPMLAVAPGISQAMQQIAGPGLVGLCWAHLQGVKFTSVMPVAGQLPDASQVPLIQGRRG